MFDLEKQITEWRRQLGAEGVKAPEPLGELELHLREDIRNHISGGELPERAFELAAARLGKPGALRTEFNKLKSASCQAVTVGSWLWIGAMVIMALLLTRGMFVFGFGLLLCAHILSLTGGYAAALLAGFFGICYLCYGWFNALSPGRQQSLGRSFRLFNWLAAAMVVVGTILGMFWSVQQLGYLGGWPSGSVPHHIKETGAVCASVWLIAVSCLLRFGKLSDRAAMLLSIGGNMVIGLAWFGAGIMFNDYRFGMDHRWAVAVAVFFGVHFLFLALGRTSTRATAES